MSERGTIRGLSIRQPFASAIIEAPKEVWKDLENRTWLPPGFGLADVGQTNDRVPDAPLWLAIHAGREWYKFPDRALGLALKDMADTQWPGMPPASGFPMSAFLGLVRVDRVLHATDARVADNQWRVGPLCWQLVDRAALREHGMRPLSARGKQGLWRLDDSELAVFRELFRRAGRAA